MFKAFSFTFLFFFFQSTLPVFAAGLDWVHSGIMTQAMYDSLVAAEESGGYRVRLLSRTEQRDEGMQKQLIVLFSELPLLLKTQSEASKPVLDAFAFRGLENEVNSAPFSLSAATLKHLKWMFSIPSRSFSESDEARLIREAHLPRLIPVSPPVPPIPDEPQVKARPQTLAEAIAEAIGDDPALSLPHDRASQTVAESEVHLHPQPEEAQNLNPTPLPTLASPPEAFLQESKDVSLRTPSERRAVLETLKHLLKTELRDLLPQTLQPETLGADPQALNFEDLPPAVRENLTLHVGGIGLRLGPLSFQSLYEHRHEILQGDLSGLDPIPANATINFNLEDQHRPDFWERVAQPHTLLGPALFAVTICTYIPSLQCWISPELSSTLRASSFTLMSLYALTYATHFVRGGSTQDLPPYLAPLQGIIRSRNQTRAQNISKILNDYPEVSALLVLTRRAHQRGMENILTETYGFKREELR